LGLVWFPIAR